MTTARQTVWAQAPRW